MNYSYMLKLLNEIDVLYADLKRSCEEIFWQLGSSSSYETNLKSGKSKQQHLTLFSLIASSKYLSTNAVAYFSAYYSINDNR